MERDMRFFKNVYQVDGDFNGESAKLPVFYYDGTNLTGVFLAKMSALNKMMPQKNSYRPAAIFPGVGAIAITCFEYRDTDIRPYNEISISIPMTYKSAPLIPSSALLTGLSRNEFHVYVRHLPVTTELARAAGVAVYNFPKLLSTIEFAEEAGEITVTLAEDGDLILKLFAKKIPAGKPKTYSFITYPVKDDCAQRADVLVGAKQFGQSLTPGSVRIELGENHKIAKELKSALIGRSSIMHQYAPEFQAILYPPSRLE